MSSVALTKIHKTLSSKIAIAISLPIFYVIKLTDSVLRYDRTSIYPNTTIIFIAGVIGLLLSCLAVYLFYKSNNKYAKWFLAVYIGITGLLNLFGGSLLLYHVDLFGFVFVSLVSYLTYNTICIVKY